MKRLFLVAVFSLFSTSLIAGGKTPKPRISVSFDPSFNHPASNARIAVVGTPYVLDFYLLGPYPTTPTVVAFEIEGELVAATQLTDERLISFRYTFSTDDYYTAMFRGGSGSAEFPEPPPLPNESPSYRNLKEVSGNKAEIGIKCSVIQVKFDSEGRPSRGKVIVSTTYRVVLSCLDCTA